MCSNGENAHRQMDRHFPDYVPRSSWRKHASILRHKLYEEERKLVYVQRMRCWAERSPLLKAIPHTTKRLEEIQMCT
jgi:hypothetical protein